MTRDTVSLMPALSITGRRPFAISSCEERAPGIDMCPIERSPRKEARPFGRLHILGRRQRPASATSLSGAHRDRRHASRVSSTGTRTSSMVLAPASDLPRRLTASTPARKRFPPAVPSALPMAIKQVNHRGDPEGAADLHHQCHSGLLHRRPERSCPCKLVFLGGDGVEAALHVDAVVAVADRLVQRWSAHRRMGDNGVGATPASISLPNSTQPTFAFLRSPPRT